MMNENDLSRVIVEAAIEVHRVLGGPGLLEGVYEEALVEELRLRGLQTERQQAVPVLYKGKLLATPLRLKLGLVISFGQRLVKDGIHRVANGL